MDPLPEDVEARLLRGLSAYLRATPTTELPPKLRRFQNFRPKSLATHRRQVLDALDDDGLRALVVEWLDDKPTLAKDDAAALRVAAERADGWSEKLAGASAPKPSGTPAKQAVDPGERERDKLRKARDEAKRRYEATQNEVVKLRARIDDLERRLELERTDAAGLRKEADAAQRAAAKATSALEREQRKARAATERAHESTQRARAELKAARRELQTVRKELERVKSAKRPARSPVKPQPVHRGPRSALPVPKGRFEDDPATLEEWLGAPDVHLLVDGYNASMSSAGFANLDLETQRERLIEELTRLARRKKTKATVVFDGSDVTSLRRRPRGPVRVQYSAPDEIADDHLVALLESLPPTPVVVATSDRELQERAAALGATIATSEQLLGLMR